VTQGHDHEYNSLEILQIHQQIAFCFSALVLFLLLLCATSHFNVTLPQSILPTTMADISKDELQPEQTEGFKVSEAKTIDEYKQLGKEDDKPGSGPSFLPSLHQAVQLSFI